MFNFLTNIFKKEEKPCMGIIGPDPHDSRDFKYVPDKSTTQVASTSILKNFSLKPLSCPVLNQKQTGSCTGHSAAVACNILLSKILGNPKNYKVNPYFIYYYARYQDGLHLMDNGAYMRSLMKALKEYGFCACDMTTPKDIPDEDLLKETFKIKDYKRIDNNIEDIQYAIQCDRLPVIISFKVDWDLINTRNGIIEYNSEELSTSFDGYHAVAVIGWKYINNGLYFIIQNSWGTLSGDDGYYYIDSRYMLDKNAVPDIWCFSADYAF